MKLSIRACTILVLISSVLSLPAKSGYQGQAEPPNVRPDILTGIRKVKGLRLVLNPSSRPPSSADCLNEFGVPCYSPQQLQEAYGLTPLLDAGYTGTGETIVIIESFGSPTIAEDLKVFDAGYGLPDPPSMAVLAPLGSVPFDPNNSDQVGWALETTLDVEWAHAMAPGAAIVILTSPVDETQGVQGLPEFLQLEQYALDHHLGHIISQSWGTAENNLLDAEGRQVVKRFEHFYLRAAVEKVTVLSGSGDFGSTNLDLNGNLYPYPTVIFPASSPLVTAVGGTSLSLDSNGDYQAETVWNDLSGASGGGVSQLFSEPLYQYPLPPSVQTVLKHHRGIPDVAYNADPNIGAIAIYAGFFPPDFRWGITGGTSEGPPQWAGIIADANQLCGRPLGFLNRRLYLLGAAHVESQFLHDITSGNNGFNGVPGYEATRGWDLATGWGTPKLSELIRKLAEQQPED